ncbi:MAG: hypothetical protein E7471_01860 [Ruminococcaceae bacterium]|nr:hypothetical protein [Oscillospiraceae bacterium]
MKNRILALFLFAVLCGCSMGENMENMTQNGKPNTMSDFSEHGLSFAVPKLWSTSGFEAEFDEVKNDSSNYNTRTFYAMIDGVRTPVMMVSRFAKDAWDKLTEQDKNAEKAKLGTSKDGNFVYTYLIKDDVVPDSEEGKTLLDKIRKEAETLRDSIKITE